MILILKIIFIKNNVYQKIFFPKHFLLKIDFYYKSIFIINYFLLYINFYYTLIFIIN